MRTESQLFVGSVFLDEDDFSLPSGVCIFQVMAVVLKQVSNKKNSVKKKKNAKNKTYVLCSYKGLI